MPAPRGQARLPFSELAAAVDAGWDVVGSMPVGFGSAAQTWVVVEGDYFPAVGADGQPVIFATAADLSDWLGG